MTNWRSRTWMTALSFVAVGGLLAMPMTAHAKRAV
jgi:hypothetical protein